MNKVGLSYSRCLHDIISGNVKIDDILVIITGTNFCPDNDQHWQEIWRGYRNSAWHVYPDEMEDVFRSVTLELYKSGKLHQPRQYGASAPSSQNVWLTVTDV